MNPSPARKPPSLPPRSRPKYTHSSCASGARQHLVHGERLAEGLLRAPALLVDALALDHRDLRRRPAQASVPNFRKRMKIESGESRPGWRTVTGMDRAAARFPPAGA